MTGRDGKRHLLADWLDVGGPHLFLLFTEYGAPWQLDANARIIDHDHFSLVFLTHLRASLV